MHLELSFLMINMSTRLCVLADIPHEPWFFIIIAVCQPCHRTDKKPVVEFFFCERSYFFIRTDIFTGKVFSKKNNKAPEKKTCTFGHCTVNKHKVRICNVRYKVPLCSSAPVNEYRLIDLCNNNVSKVVVAVTEAAGMRQGVKER